MDQGGGQQQKTWQMVFQASNEQHLLWHFRFGSSQHPLWSKKTDFRWETDWHASVVLWRFLPDKNMMYSLVMQEYQYRCDMFHLEHQRKPTSRQKCMMNMAILSTLKIIHIKMMFYSISRVTSLASSQACSKERPIRLRRGHWEWSEILIHRFGWQ